MADAKYTGGHLYPKGVSGNPGGRPKGNPAVKNSLANIQRKPHKQL